MSFWSQARAETDETKRAAMYAEMQQLVHDDGGLVNVVFNNFVDAHAKTLAHGDIGRELADRRHEDRRALVVCHLIGLDKGPGTAGGRIATG